jgi:hypothetical protein
LRYNDSFLEKWGPYILGKRLKFSLNHAWWSRGGDLDTGLWYFWLYPHLPNRPPMYNSSANVMNLDLKIDIAYLRL